MDIRDSADEIDALKQRLRVRALARRRGQPDKDALSAAIHARLAALPEFVAAGKVLYYVDARSEVRTRGALQAALASGRGVLVPFCAGDRLELFRLESMDELASGSFGILEPREELRRAGSRRVAAGEVDLALVPGVAFGPSGARLGHGQGFYDRLLAELRPDAARIGLAYESQILPHLPTQAHDVRLHKIVTERTVYACAERTAADLLDATRLSALGLVTRIEHHATVGSTNDRAREAAVDAPRDEVLLIVADQQTSGRGRGANRWWTGAGSLAFSLLLDPAARGIERRHSHLMSLAAAVAVVESIRPRIGGHELGLHWPNDVFAAGRKIAGILVEALPDGRHILGIGVNVNNSLAEAPDELRAVATTLLDLTRTPHDRTDVLAALVLWLDAALAQLAADPARLGRRADGLCLQHRRELTIESGNRRATGLCAGIDVDGALLLDTPQGREKFYSGVLVKH